MSEEFETHIKIVLPDWYDDFSECDWKHTVEYVNKLQAKIDAQAEELKALRGFANDVCKNYMWSIGVDASFKLFNQHGLIDDNGNPTKILTG